MTLTVVRPPQATDHTPVTASPVRLAQLLARAGDSDEAAFAEFYDATCQLVYGMSLRFTKEPSRAESATAQVYVAAWRSAPSFARSDRSAVVWLMALTYEQLKAFAPAS